MFRKNKLAMLVGEFLGTTALTLIILSISHSQLSLSYFVATSAGLMFALMVLALGGISGAVFNPAMTIGLWTVRKLRTLQALTYLAVQFLGGAVAWWLFVYFTKVSGIHNTGTFSARVMLAEAVGTFIFAFVWAAAVYQRFNLFNRAVAIGGGLTAGALVASLASAGLLNPAVALGLRQWSWGTYVAGPIIGAIVGFQLYNLLFVQTEVAEVEEAHAENANVAVSEPVRTRTVGTTRRKTVAAKATPTPARNRGTTVKKTASRRKNPNAV
jgi:glycerol uptake facilitator-like aquaporin